MAYKLHKDTSIHVDKVGIAIDVFPQLPECGVVIGETDTGHNQEFYHRVSSFTYIITKGSADFFLDDENVHVKAGDMLTIDPGTHIYYKGAFKFVLITTPPWTEEGEVETKEKIW